VRITLSLICEYIFTVRFVSLQPRTNPDKDLDEAIALSLQESQTKNFGQDVSSITKQSVISTGGLQNKDAEIAVPLSLLDPLPSGPSVVIKVSRVISYCLDDLTLSLLAIC
jgi:hypothetical protein